MKKHALMAAMVILLTSCTQGGPRASLSERLPSITLKSAGGTVISLPENYGGKVAAILFWSEGCEFCKKEMPLMEPLYQRLKDKGFEFVAVQVTGTEDASRRISKDFGITFDMLTDSENNTKRLYGIAGVPTIFIIDRQGVLREKILGGLGSDALEGLIEGLL